MANRPDEDLILHFYGEHPAPDDVARELAEDGDLRRRYEALSAELAAMASVEGPEPRPGLEQRLWARLAPRLAPAPRGGAIWSVRPWLRLAFAGAAALGLVYAGYFLGRREPLAPPAPATAELAGLGADERARLLTATLVSHLDASERLLVELANDRTAPADQEQAWAQALLASNRLYRRAAERAGQRRVAALLSELEPLLLEIAHGADDGASPTLDTAHERIADRDLLFKLRITRNNL
jgi:hypothetical protein